MRKNKFFCFLSLIFFLFSLFSPAYAADSLHETEAAAPPPEISVSAKAAILLDGDTGQVLYRQEDEKICYPASTTKIMTCYLALKYMDINQWVTLPEGIGAGLNSASSTASLKSGEEMTVYQLLQCLMIVSANEAANAVAILISGSIPEFADLMNREALALGCAHTNFVNPNGLHDDDHYSCARDLALITLAAMEYDVFLELCGTVVTTMPATNLSEERTLSATNYLLPGSEHPEYDYSGAFGVKTGYTTPAGHCLVSGACWEGRTLVAVVLGAEKTGQDIGSFSESRKLLDWGFYNYDAALTYQSDLDAQAAVPEPTPEPTPEPSPSPSPSPSPTPSPSPSPSPSLSPTPQITPSPSPQGQAVTLISGVANHLGISPQALLVGVIALAAAGLAVLIVVMIRMLRHRK